VVHQHLNIGQGELDWDTFFRTLAEVKFDGMVSNSVFAWPDKAEQSARFMLQKMQEYLAKYRKD
jgi:myo-inositol catabolism protein IolH